MSARPFIDSLDFARNGRKISGEVPVAWMLRLLDMLEIPQGNLSYTVRGGLDKQGKPFLDVSIVGSCQLRCQRCLGTLAHEVLIDTRLLLCDQATLDALGDDEGEYDSILADAQLDVPNLLEEEILLSLPIAPRHDPGACQAGKDRIADKEEKHPFAALAKLRVVK